MSQKPNADVKSRRGDDLVPTSFGPIRVLIADDEHLMVTSSSTAIVELGHTVAGVAADGEAALEVARRVTPDLALLDIRMPKVNGIDLARVLFTELRIPSIIVSAYSDQEHVGKIQSFGAQSGVFGYLIKPVSKDELRVAIGVALQRIAVEEAMDTRITQLENNLANRRTVEQAKWVLVKKHGWDEPTAHERMQKVARDRRSPLVEVAAQVIATGDLPA
jgi:response regulator NasT